jgi:hypothetical protein
VASVGTRRRYYLLKAREARARDEEGLALTFEGKQREVAGTPLPALPPAITTKLAAAGYLVREDILAEDGRGADEEELQVDAGLSKKEAAAVLAALG